MNHKRRRPALGQRIFNFRTTKGWDQRDFGKEAGLHPITVSHLETGFTAKPNRDTMKKLKAVLRGEMASPLRIRHARSVYTEPAKAPEVVETKHELSPINLSKPENLPKIIRIYYDKGSFISLKHPISRKELDKVVDQLNYLEVEE